MYVALLLLFFHGTHLRKCFPRVLCLGFPGGPVVESPPLMQETWVPFLAQKDPTCHRATKPKHHSY